MTRETEAPQAPVRWYNSLIVRVVALCAVLVATLMGLVYALTQHYFGEIVRDMQAQTEEVAQRILLELNKNPELDPNDIVSGSPAEFPIKVDASPDLSAQEPGFTLEWGPDGQVTKVARLLVKDGDRTLLVTARVTLSPQTEIVRAFRNRYLVALTAVFVATLVLLVLSVARLLRPIGELSESCEAIRRGELHDVAVRNKSGEVAALERTFNAMVASLRDKEVMEVKLRQAQRLSAIGTLAAGVAHDIRNPLNAIKLLSSHALDNLDGPDAPENERAVKPLQTIRNEVDRLEDIVSGFLSLAKERELQTAPTRIDGLLEECVRLLAKDAEQRGIRLLTELRAGDTTFMLDSQQCVRAILNVLINALEACPEGGRVRLFSRLTDTACEIEVRDDGPGMPKEIAERAFDPYFTAKATGTGLGLSITRGIIEEHGGTIELFTQEGQGCQALIALPLEARVT